MGIGYHGTGRLSWFCTDRSQANIPRHIADDESTTSSQMLSCSSGQWYRRLVLRIIVVVVVVVVMREASETSDITKSDKSR